MIQVFVDELTESNCYVIESNNRNIVIDPNQSKELEKWIEENPVIDFILLTHEHCDHMSGLNKMRKNIPVICSMACNIGIQDSRKNMSGIMEVYLHFRGKENIHYDAFICDKAQITFEEEYEMKWQQYKVMMKRVPGHTIGSSCIFLEKENKSILFTGDYLIWGEKVITRLQSGDTQAYNEIGKKYLERLPENLHVYPGHGKDYILDREGNWRNGL